MTGRYRMSDGAIYEVYEVKTGKGKVQATHYEMKCIESKTKTTGVGFTATPEYFDKLKQSELITKL